MLYLRTMSRRKSMIHLYAMTAAKCSDAKSGHGVHKKIRTEWVLSQTGASLIQGPALFHPARRQSFSSRSNACRQ